MTEFEQRKRLTFEQAEGAEPLPTQLKLKELSQELRALLWLAVNTSLDDYKYTSSDHTYELLSPWDNIFFSMHIYRDHGMADEFENDFHRLREKAKAVIVRGDYVKVFGWIQFVLRRQDRPDLFKERIEAALEKGRAAYRIVDGDTIAPIGTQAEGATLHRAFVDLAATELHGARAHLRKAAELLTGGQYADSIRESIHAVESVATVLEPRADVLSKALAQLETRVKIHGALKAGFNSLYGYTSDESGIRHALLEAGAPNVDEVDALFMIGACAAFVSYLINKARVSNLLPGPST